MPRHCRQQWQPAGNVGFFVGRLWHLWSFTDSCCACGKDTTRWGHCFGLREGPTQAAERCWHAFARPIVAAVVNTPRELENLAGVSERILQECCGEKERIQGTRQLRARCGRTSWTWELTCFPILKAARLPKLNRVGEPAVADLIS